MTSTDSRTSSNCAVVVPPQGLTVSTLRWWHKHGTQLRVFFRYADALHHLAEIVREDWDEENWRDDVTASPRGLTDGEAVSMFYGEDIQLAPTRGRCADGKGFEITEDPVHGSEPGELDLRLASLRVFDEDPDNPHENPLTYRLDAIGITTDIYPGRTGPVVRVNNGTLPAGLPITLILDDVRVPESTRHVHRLT